MTRIISPVLQFGESEAQRFKKHALVVGRTDSQPSLLDFQARVPPVLYWRQVPVRVEGTVISSPGQLLDSPGELCKITMPRLHPRPIKSVPLRVEPRHQYLCKAPNMHLILRTTAVRDVAKEDSVIIASKYED